MTMRDQYLGHVFSYHPPFGDQVERYQTIREAGLAFATTITELTPGDGNTTEAVKALEAVREAVMWANAAIACHETEQTDERPHSRACGPFCRGHGPACSANCPTCHGRAL